MELWQRLSHQARSAIVIAHQRAVLTSEGAIGTGHLLWGMLDVSDSHAADLLSRKGVDLDALRARLAPPEKPATAAAAPQTEAHLTEDAREALSLAWEEAKALGHEHVDTEHLLLGLLHLGRGEAHGLLVEEDLDLGDTREALRSAGDVEGPSRRVARRRPPWAAMPPPARRVGIGYDVHRLVAGRRLVLGGVAIEHPKGLAGHSDADVLLHAVADALLGACAQGDIGQHFPDTDPAYAGADSATLLGQVVRVVREQGYTVVNVDATVVAEEPRLGPYREEMRRRIAEVLGLPVESVSVKATTNEGLGSIGQGEAIAALAVAMVEQA